MSNIKVLTDLVITTSLVLRPTKAPSNDYAFVGSWQVDSGGAKGTYDQETDTKVKIVALYAKYELVESIYELESNVVDVILTVTDEGEPNPPSDSDYSWIGNWDIDDGGGEGTNGQTGANMGGLYQLKTSSLLGDYISDIQLTASNESKPKDVDGAVRRGYWDVGTKYGGNGTDGSTGGYMMGLYIR